MRTQTRLIALLAVLAVMFVATLLLLRALDGQRAARLYGEVAREKGAAVDKLLELKGALLESLARDYTFWDEMVRFVRTGDRRWAAENIDTALSTFGVDGVWVYRTDFSLAYATDDLRDARWRNLPLPPTAAPRLFGGSPFAHFFVQTPAGLMEIRGATIHPTSDSQRKSPPRGFFFAGRLWNVTYVRELSNLLEGSILLLPAGQPAPVPDDSGRGGVVTVTKLLPGWDGKPVARVQVRSSSPIILELNRSAGRQFLLLLAFSLVVLVLPSVLIARWVYRPLQKISASLDAKDPAPLGALPQDGTEFGHLAKLVLRFFEQSELIREITERRRTAEALRETEQRFRELFENASDVVFTHDLAGNFTAINRAGEELTGYTREDVLAKTIAHLFAADSLARVRQEIDRQMQGGLPSGYEVELRTKDGRTVPVEVVTGLIHADRKPVGVQGIARDITERRRVEEEIRRLNAQLEQRVQERTAQLAERERELHEAKAFLEHLIAGSPSVIFRVDPRDETVTYISPNVHRFLGYRSYEVLRQPRFWAERIHPDDQEAVQTALQRAVGERASQFETEYRFRHKDGEHRWLSSLARLEYDAAGRLFSVFGYALDVTERKAAEEAVRQAKTEAERASLAKNEFLSRMSHELRTPLNAILGFAQLLEMDPLPVEQSESVAHILKGGQHLLELINEVLDISRIEAGRLTLSPEPVHVGQVLQEALEMIAPLAAQRAIRVGGDLGDADYYVLADLQRLKQVLLNLLSNAVKYNNPGGALSVSCGHVLGDRLRISVRDTGRGIPPEKMSQLFVPFARLGAEQTGVEGTGIGLAVSKGLVEVMGGEIGVESAVGQGSTFWVELPLVESQLQRAQRMWQDNLPASEDGTVSVSAGTVLYIEDNLANLELLQRILADRPQIKLVAAMQGRMGLDLARQHRPDLILLDVHLPDLPGEEVLRRLRADPLTWAIPVVIISADPTSGQTERLLAIGAYGYLAKPIDIKQLLRTLDESLRGAEARHAGRPT